MIAFSKFAIGITYADAVLILNANPAAVVQTFPS